MKTEELKRLAEAATMGPWEYQKDSKDFPVKGYVTVRDCIYSVCVLPYEGIRADDRVTDNGRFIAAANPAAVLELIAEVDRLREDADDLTIALESSEKALKDSRANDYTAMGYLADCRMAVGDNGKRMLPEFVEYLRQLKQQRDELLAALKYARELVDDWGAYASNYMQEKHDLAGDLDRLDAAISKVEK